MLPAKYSTSQCITLFGGYGFIGNYLLKRLCARGHRVRLAVASERTILPKDSQHPLAEVFGCSLGNPDSLEEVIRDADAVVNLIGILNPNKERGFRESHEDWPAAITAATKEVSGNNSSNNSGNNKKPHLVHISALGASADAASEYLRSKYAGEQKVAAYRHRTIIRPSLVYGNDSPFARKMLGMLRYLPCLWLPAGSSVTQPIMVEDLRDLILHILQKPEEFREKTLSAAGPEVMNMRRLLQIIARHELGKRRIVLPMSQKMSFRMADLCEKWTKNPPITRDNCLSAYAAVWCSPEENDALKILGHLLILREQFYLRKGLKKSQH